MLHQAPEQSTPTTKPGSLCPPTSRRQLLLRVVATLGVVSVIVSGMWIDFGLGTLSQGIDDILGLVERMLPPRMEEPTRIVDLAVETLLIALLGTVLATAASIPLALLAARTTTPNPTVYAVARGLITVCRAVPDLVFAVLLVRALGIGVLPGVLALALHSIGMLGKLFADAIEHIDAGPREAVRATGAGRFRELLNGVIPQVVPAWIAAFCYRVDINLRMSVVLGFVGAGGIGFALQDALRGLVYDSALGIVVVILVIIAAVELVSIVLRRELLRAPTTPHHARSGVSHGSRRPWGRERIVLHLSGWALVAATVYAFVSLGIDVFELVRSPAALIEMVARLAPPDFTAVGSQLWDAVAETVAIGVVATAIGVMLSVPVGILAARGIAPHPVVYAAARSLVLVVRAVPELVLAVVFVAAIGLGPIAGTCALGLGSVGFCGKLVADAVEEVAPGPREAVRAAGGGWWKQLTSAVLPQAMPAMLGSGLYLLDVNIRTSTVLGIVGAGGVGFLLFEAIRTLQFEFAGAIICVVFVIVYLIERLSGWVRSQVT